MNIFENYNLEKEKMRMLCKQAAEYGWISAEYQQELEKKLDNEVLTIGVIGQMKAGKSTFLNAFVFERDVLPAATTPMTAALSIITYGEEEKVEVEFYSREEWEEQCLNAKKNIEEITDELIKSKVQAAQELVKKAEKLGSRLEELLGKTQTDTLDHLIEYVGADGRFVSITKSVKIYYPKEYLKGVEIVDTPGFNDPIVSREQRTTDFLEKADVVLMMLYAGRPFDATDREIIFKHLRKCGIGKLVVGINKYDIPFENGETEEEIKQYVVEEIRRASRDLEDESLKELLREATPIPISAEMALLSYLPISTISSNDKYKYAWDRHCDNFEISTQADFRTKSLFFNLSERIQEIVMNEKAAILFAKPRNSIKAIINHNKLKIEQDIKVTKDNIYNLSLSDEELEEKQEKLEKVKKKLERKTKNYLKELEEKLNDLQKKYRRKIEDKIDNKCNEAMRAIKISGSRTNESTMRTKVYSILEPLYTRIIPRTIEDFEEDKKDTIIQVSKDEYIDETSNILHRLFEEDDIDTIISTLKDICDSKPDDNFIGDDIEKTSSESSIMKKVQNFLTEVFSSYVGLFESAGRLAIGNSDIKNTIIFDLLEYKENFYINDELEKIVNIESLESQIKELMFDNFLTPLQENLKDVIEKKEERKQNLINTQAELKELEQKKEILQKQIATVIL